MITVMGKNMRQIASVAMKVGMNSSLALAAAASTPWKPFEVCVM